MRTTSVEVNGDIYTLTAVTADVSGAISIELISNKISQVQRLIWEHRKHCFLIPDFFYKINKKEQQEIEDLLSKESRENLNKLKGNDNSKK